VYPQSTRNHPVLEKENSDRGFFHFPRQFLSNLAWLMLLLAKVTESNEDGLHFSTAAGQIDEIRAGMATELKD
ncbi:hypothetical protein, partial [Agrobacterium pusense]|uniref:hypothetical protein n=1 Tax=Agrobacterium pusense TaxID=648995 RepID=UPI00244C2BDA